MTGRNKITSASWSFWSIYALKDVKSLDGRYDLSFLQYGGIKDGYSIIGHDPTKKEFKRLTFSTKSTVKYLISLKEKREIEFNESLLNLERIIQGVSSGKLKDLK